MLLRCPCTVRGARQRRSAMSPFSNPCARSAEISRSRGLEPAAGLREADLARRADRSVKRLRVDGLLEEVEGTALERPHGRAHVAVARDEDDRQRERKLLHAGLQLEAAHAGHADVKEQAPGGRGGVVAQERVRAPPGGRPPALAGEHEGERLAHLRVIVDDADERFELDSVRRGGSHERSSGWLAEGAQPGCVRRRAARCVR